MTDKTRVLLIEDSEEDRTAFRRAVKAMNENGGLGGFEIREAPALEQGLDLLREERFDIVLLDLSLPDSQDLEGLKKIRAEHGNSLPVNVLTGRQWDDKTSIAAIQAGAQDYILKQEMTPYNLGRSIAYAVERSRMAKEIDELRIRQATNMKLATLGEMAGCMAHEINNPLTVILALSERLLRMRDETPDSKMRAECLEKVIATTMRVSKIVKGLSSYARKDTDDGFERTKLAAIMEDTLTLCSDRFKVSCVDLIVERIDDVELSCKGIQLSQVLLNLLNNAVDAVKDRERRWVKISSRVEGGTLSLDVVDSGEAIGERVRKQLFHPFFTTKKRGLGTGLGLAISRNIVQAHEGTLELVENEPNTTFRLRLPLGAKSQKSPQSSQRAAEPA